MHIKKTTTDDHVLFVYLLALLANKNMSLFTLQTKSCYFVLSTFDLIFDTATDHVMMI